MTKFTLRIQKLIGSIPCSELFKPHSEQNNFPKTNKTHQSYGSKLFMPYSESDDCLKENKTHQTDSSKLFKPYNVTSQCLFKNEQNTPKLWFQIVHAI